MRAHSLLRRRSLAVPLLLVLLLIAAGCSDDENSAEVGTSGEPTSTTATSEAEGASTTLAPSTTAAPFQGDTQPVTAEPTAQGTSLLTAVRVASSETADRIEFEFEGAGLPGYDVRYVEPPITEDGSGEEVEVQGGSYLQIRMEPASGFDLSAPEGRQTYTGPERVSGDTKAVAEVVRTGDFEAVLNWVAGLTEKAKFKVTPAQNPSRLIIEVDAPASASGGGSSGGSGGGSSGSSGSSGGSSSAGG